MAPEQGFFGAGMLVTNGRFIQFAKWHALLAVFVQSEHGRFDHAYFPNRFCFERLAVYNT